ncbi:MAG: hypothetical protein P9X24_00820 [Candidatus Hatepunaea meridiana]|nr:hypothetical protein [Candidatus Hatepunaea meridiana]
MWRLIVTELSYKWSRILVMFALMLFLINFFSQIITFFDPDTKKRLGAALGFVFFSECATLPITIMFFSAKSRKNRLSVHSMLTLNPVELGLARIVPLLIIHIILTAVWMISTQYHNIEEQQRVLTLIIAMNGLWISLFLIVNMWMEYCREKKVLKTIFLTVLIIAGLSFMLELKFEYKAVYYLVKWLFKSVLVNKSYIIHSLIAVSVMGFYLRTFARRRSFLS